MATKPEIFQSIITAYEEQGGKSGLPNSFPERRHIGTQQGRYYLMKELAHVVEEARKSKGADWGPSGPTGSRPRNYTDEQTEAIFGVLQAKLQKKIVGPNLIDGGVTEQVLKRAEVIIFQAKGDS